MCDLILKGGRLIDPAQSFDGIADICFADGRVVQIGTASVPGPSTEVRDIAGLIVTPGLIDFHTHVYWGGTSLGVAVEPVARRSGTTTFVDAGSAGPGNFHGFRRHVIEPSPLRILAYLNISFAGIYAFGPTIMIGECEDPRLLDLRECVRIAEQNRDLVLGVKVRVGMDTSGGMGLAPLDMAIEAAEALDLPVMAHLDSPPPSRREVMDRLRPGDIITHCFRPFPNAPLGPRREVRQEIFEARRRGVIFDLGHGAGSFAFDTARGMLDAGFLPDVLSSDIHSLSVNGPAFDILSIMSKFLCLGVGLNDLIRSATAAAALAMRRSDLGTLTPGSTGDAAILRVEEGEFDFVDTVGERLRGTRRFALHGMVVGGRWCEPETSFA